MENHRRYKHERERHPQHRIHIFTQDGNNSYASMLYVGVIIAILCSKKEKHLDAKLDGHLTFKAPVDVSLLKQLEYLEENHSI